MHGIGSQKVKGAMVSQTEIKRMVGSEEDGESTANKGLGYGPSKRSDSVNRNNRNKPY